MPIVRISALPQPARLGVSRLLVGLSKAIATECDCPLEQVTVTWQALKPGHYAEAGVAKSRQPKSSHPPLVQLTCFEMDDEKSIARMMAVVAAYLSKELRLPRNVFVLFEVARAGRVFAQGEVVA